MNGICKLFLMVLCIYAVPSRAQGVIQSEDRGEVRPGSASSVPFLIRNASPQSRSFHVRVHSSDSLVRAVLPTDRLVLQAGDSAVLIVPLVVHPVTSPGEKVLTVSTFDESDGYLRDHVAKIRISSVRELSIRPLDPLVYVRAGEPMRQQVVIKNLGNAPEVLSLRSRGHIQGNMHVLSLSPGEEVSVGLYHQTDPGLGSVQTHNLDLSVFTADTSAAPYIFNHVVSVIPVRPKKDDIYQRFPISGSLSLLGMNDRGVKETGLQGEVHGRGRLSKGGKDELEFRAVTKNPIQFNTFSRYEEYYVNYSRKNLFVHLGDKVFSSSMLTEYARYGRGAEIRFDMGRLSLGGFYNRPRFYRDIDREYGLRTTMRLDSITRFTAGYLYKVPSQGTGTGPGSPYLSGRPAHLPYIMGQTRLFRDVGISGELSVSRSGRDWGTGYRLRANLNRSGLQAGLDLVGASPTYAGYYNNTTMFNGNLRYLLQKRVEILGSVHRDARNFQRDTLLYAAPFRNTMQYGLNFRYHKDGSIMFFNGYQRYRDRLVPQQFNYDELFVRVSLEQVISDLQVNLESQFGKTRNHITAFTGSSNYFTANLSIDRLNTLFSLFGSLARTSRYTERDQRQLYYGGRAISRLSPRTSVNLFYQNNYMPEDYFRDRSQFELGVNQRVGDIHSFDLSGRYMIQRGSLGNRDFIFSLRYTMKLGIPIRKLARYSSLRGSVRNLGVGSIEGIRLNLADNISVTDQNGAFSFKNVVPGDHILEIDRSGIPLGDIPDVPLPVRLNISEDSERTFDFGMTRAARISGKFSLERPQSAGTVGERTGKPPRTGGIIIEASNGSEVYRKRCGIGEAFDFSYLRPGKWTVRAYLGDLSKEYRMDRDLFEVDLAPGTEYQVTFRITRKEFEIRQQAESIEIGHIKEEKK